MGKSFEIIISGMVQGIGYRAFTVRNANLLNIKGFVKNLYDGRVKVVAVGEESKVRAFVDILKIGPTYASVKSVDLHELDAAGDYEDFRIGF